MKGGRAFIKYLLFVLFIIAVICAAIFFFHITEKTQKPTSITITPYDDTPTEYTNVSSVKTSASSRTTASKTTVHTSVSAAATTACGIVSLDINTASADELKKLKGIGDVFAQEIISYRESSGGFRNIEEIMNVKGIGESIFADIRNHIYVADPVYDTRDETPVSKEPAEEEPHEEEHTPTLEELAPININTADRDILLMLPHVDEDTADRMIEFRESTGGFRNEYELLLIEGLSHSDVDDIIQFITI